MGWKEEGAQPRQKDTGHMKLTRIAALVMLPAIAVTAKKPITWETATVVEQHTSSDAAGAYAAPIGAGTIAVPIYRLSNIVVVDVGSYRYQWLEHSSGRSYGVFAVHDTLRFYRDGNWFMIADSKGKAHKFSLIAAERRE